MSTRLPTFVHHLSEGPPETEPLTAFAGPSLATQGLEPVAGRPSARLAGAAGASGAVTRCSDTTGATEGTPAASTAKSM